MTVALTRTVSLAGGGKTVKEQQSISCGSVIARSESTPAAKSGTLDTRTDNDTGVAVLGASHGVATGNRVDVYWSGGKRRGMTVGTVSGTSVPIDGGTGDNLPSAATALLVAVCQEHPILFDGDNMQALFVGSAARGTLVFANAADAELLHVNIAADGLSYSWDENNGVTNPLASGDIAKVFMTHNAVAAKVQTVIVGTT